MPSPSVDSLALISNNGSPMNVVFAVLADAANVSQEGKLNILGNFANIKAREFPIRHPQMQLVIRMEASPLEAGKEKNIEVTMLAADGQKISSFSANFTVPQPKNPGEDVQLQTVLYLRDTVFPQPGRYALHVLINGSEEARVPLTLTLEEGE